MKYGGSGKKDIDAVVDAEKKLHQHGGLVQTFLHGFFYALHRQIPYILVVVM